MGRKGGSNKTNRADSTGPSGTRPTTMEKNTTTIKPTDNGIILAISDTNTTPNHDNSKHPNSPKPKPDTLQTKARKAKSKLHI